MVNTNLNIRTDKEVKNQAEKIFNALGMNMTTAVNIFLKTTIREMAFPSVSLLTFLMQQLDLPLKKANESPLIKSKGYTNMTDLRVALENEVRSKIHHSI